MVIDLADNVMGGAARNLPENNVVYTCVRQIRNTSYNFPR